MTLEEIKAKAIAHKAILDKKAEERALQDEEDRLEINKEIADFIVSTVKACLPQELAGSDYQIYLQPFSLGVDLRSHLRPAVLEIDIDGTFVLVRYDGQNQGKVQYSATHDGRLNPVGLDWTDDFWYALACSMENFK